MFHTKAQYGMNPATINGLFEELFQNGWGKIGTDGPTHMNVPVNIQETDTAYDVQLVAPGLKKEYFKLNVEKNVLTISYEQKEEQKDDKTKMLRNEYHFRPFKRSFTLNDKVNTTGINAKYADGILNVQLPKKEQAEPATQDIPVV